MSRNALLLNRCRDLPFLIGQFVIQRDAPCLSYGNVAQYVMFPLRPEARIISERIYSDGAKVLISTTYRSPNQNQSQKKNPLAMTPRLPQQPQNPHHVAVDG